MMSEDNLMFLCPKIYKLLSAVGLDLPYPIHAVWVIVNEWHNQPHFTLLPPLQPHRPPTLPLPITILLGTGSVWRKSKIREKTDLGAWGRLSGCFSQIREIREKTDYRGERVNERGWVATLCFDILLSFLIYWIFYS